MKSKGRETGGIMRYNVVKSVKLADALYDWINTMRVHGFDRNYESNDPIRLTRWPEDLHTEDADMLCRAAGVACILDGNAMFLCGRASLLGRLHGPLEAVTVRNVFEFNMLNAVPEAHAAWKRIQNADKVAHTVAAEYPDLRDWRVKGSVQFKKRTGSLMLGGILPSQK